VTRDPELFDNPCGILVLRSKSFWSFVEHDNWKVIAIKGAIIRYILNSIHLTVETSLNTRYTRTAIIEILPALR
jgi:hypothetical protein